MLPAKKTKKPCENMASLDEVIKSDFHSVVASTLKRVVTVTSHSLIVFFFLVSTQSVRVKLLKTQNFFIFCMY